MWSKTIPQIAVLWVWLMQALSEIDRGQAIETGKS